MAVLLIIQASNHTAVYAQSSTLSAKGWTVSVSWTNPDQPSGSATTITMVFNVLHSVYDLQVTVAGQGLSISNNLGSGNSYTWGQLNEGDTRQIQFLVSTPSQASVGNRYNVTVQAQSYSTPAGLFGARSPFDTSSDKDSTSFLLHVAPVQVMVQPESDSVDWGSLAAVGVIAFIVVIALLYAWSRSPW